MMCCSNNNNNVQWAALLRPGSPGSRTVISMTAARTKEGRELAEGGLGPGHAPASGWAWLEAGPGHTPSLATSTPGAVLGCCCLALLATLL